MYNFKICERILKIIVGLFAMFICSIFNEIKVLVNEFKTFHGILHHRCN